MKKTSILLPAAVVGVLFSAMVLAAPPATSLSGHGDEVPNRAEAYLLASTN